MIFVNCKLFFNILINQGQSYLIINRFIKSSRNLFDENNSLCDVNKKGKVIAVKKKFTKDKEASFVEWKSAADVIKKLNFEYKYLYGPVKPNGQGGEIEDNENQVIQHETQIPVIEPLADYTKDQIFYKDEKLDLSCILTFPLTNKSAFPKDKINELNFLRKQLEMLSETSEVPSVTKILQDTMPKERKEILNKWKQSMISKMGEESFKKYQLETLANGASLHHSICSFLVSTPDSELHIKEENIGHWKSLKYVLPNIREVKLLEEFVTHPFLCYRGVVDCFAKYRDRLVVIDWKTSKKSKANIRNTYDDPLQIAAYVGALNFDPKYQYLASKGLLIIAYENGMPATSHFINESTMEHYWNEWLKRIKQFWEMRISQSETS